MLFKYLCILLFMNKLQQVMTEKKESPTFLLDNILPVPHDEILLVLPVQHKRKPADGSNEKQNLYCTH